MSKMYYFLRKKKVKCFSFFENRRWETLDSLFDLLFDLTFNQIF